MDALRGRWSGALIVVVGASLFGTLGTLSRFAYDAGLTPFALVAWRAGIGAVGTWLVIGRRGGLRSSLGSLRSAEPAARRWLLLAVVAGACVNLAIFVAFERTTIALALLAFYTFPAMVAAASALLGHERMDATRWAALGLALGGMVGVVAGGLGQETTVRVDVLGIGLALVAAACQTAYVVASRGFRAIGTEEATGTALVGMALIAVVVTAFADGPAVLLRPLGSPGLVLLLAFVGLFAAALPWYLFLTGIRLVGPVRAGILMLFEPVVGVALAAAALGEGLAPLQVVGGLTILLAAVLVQRRSASPQAGGQLVEAPITVSPGGP